MERTVYVRASNRKDWKATRVEFVRRIGVEDVRRSMTEASSKSFCGKADH